MASLHKKFAVFDVDGTIIRWQLYHSLVDRLARAGYLGHNSAEAIHDARMNWKNRTSQHAYSAYEELLVSTYEKALQSLSLQQLTATAAEVVEQYQHQTYIYTTELITALKKDNYILLAISGSHDILIAPILQNLGFDDWLGSNYEHDGQNFTGASTIPSHDKQRAVMTLMTKWSLTLDGSWGVGDTQSDIAMLKMVEHPVAFNPDAQLLQYAKAHKWDVVIERKSLIYTLQAGSDGYRLT